MTFPDQPQDPLGERPESAPEPGPQQVQVPTVTARVPSFIGSGVMSTGAIIMTGAHVFVLDFLQQFGNPPQLVGRVVMPHAVMGQFIRALEQNLAMYEQSYGPPPKLPKPDQVNRPTIQEIYEHLKLPDDELPGRFSDGVMIRHSPADFCFDFVTHFFPHAAVSRRVFMSAPHVPQLLDALRVNFRKLLEQQGKPPEPPTEIA